MLMYLVLLNCAVGSGTCVGGEKMCRQRKLIMKKRGFAGLCLFPGSRCR